MLPDAVIPTASYDERRRRVGERPGTYKLGDYVVGAGDDGATPAEVRSEVLVLLDEVRDAHKAFLGFTHSVAA